MTKQWEKYRETIIAEYKDLNKPLHEVRRVMMQRYGFRASTRAYRSRFDRWGVHKYSRRRHMRSMSRSRRESISDGDLHPQSPDMEDGSAQAATPVVSKPDELLTPGICVATPVVGYRSSLCLAKTDFPYTPITPSPSPAVMHSPAFSLNQFGSSLGAFGSQNIGCWSSNSAPIYRPDPRDVVIVGSDASGQDHGTISMSGIPTGYGYSLGFLTGQE
ncbi:hypothetical protein C8A00DRAFT_17643 [Chaetomidium leptoderma]|uniref:Clr5 domain-containing protein n=1 Tax=Chaetomidium leptoderma TaxID=669021 RepID=A0AAN6VIP5_9PEZI|nr:hypothetical protein C8A00DRAFT_17643 [Chaetomidium leptoderma]